MYSNTDSHAQQAISVDNIEPTATYEHHTFTASSNRGAANPTFYQPIITDNGPGMDALSVQGSGDSLNVLIKDAIVMRVSSAINVNSDSGVTGTTRIEGGHYHNITSRIVNKWNTPTARVEIEAVNYSNIGGIAGGSGVVDLGGHTANAPKPAANQIYKMGKVGTMVGEAGWDQLQTYLLFPIPNERAIADLMSQVSDRGFTLNKTSAQPLTEYIFR